ncbi:MAG: PEP-CTERM sorting domain-containing protein, partial [Gemmataceae bacterium]
SVTNSLIVDDTSTLHLNAPLNLSGDADFRGTSTINLNNHNVTANGIFVGWYGNGTVLNDRANFTTDILFLGDQTFPVKSTDAIQRVLAATNSQVTFATGATVKYLGIESNSTATMNATAQITETIWVSNSTFNTTAPVNITGSFSLATNTIAQLNNQPVTAQTIFLGWNGPGFILNDRGNFNTPNLYVYGQNFNITGSDTVTNFYIQKGATVLPSNATVSTMSVSDQGAVSLSAVGNVTSTINISNSTLNTTAPINLGSGGQFAAHSDAILNFNNQPLTAGNVFLGWYGGTYTANQRGTITANSLFVANSPLNLTSADAVQNFYVHNTTTNIPSGVTLTNFGLTGAATGTINASTNVSTTVGVNESTLNLNAPLQLGTNSSFSIQGNTAVLNANNKSIAASQIFIGWYGGVPVINNRGTFTTDQLYVAYQNYTFTAADSTGTLDLYDSSATTVASSNISAQVNIYGTSQATSGTLTLGAPLNTGISTVNAATGAKINAQGHAITAGQVILNTNGTIINDGAITTGYWQQTGAYQVDLNNGNDSLGQIVLINGAILRVNDGPAATGLDITDSATNAIIIDSTSKLRLELNGDAPGWVLRWANPQGNNHIADLTALINEGKIEFVASNFGTYQLTNDGLYTYVFQPVPEPATLGLMAGAGVAGLGWWRRRRTTTASV